MENVLVSDANSVSVERARGVEHKPTFKGRFEIECRDKDGNLKWKDYADNGVADVGINKLLDVFFRNQTVIATWFMGLIDATSYTGLAAGDTEGSHAGWIENTAYTISGGSAVNRATWTPAAAASKSISNSTAVAFTMTSSGTIKGFFLCQDQAKATTSGVLWSTALFASGDQVVASGDILNVTYTISAA